MALQPAWSVVGASSDSVATTEAPQDFSVVLGGPLYQLLRRTHLSGDTLELVRQRTFVLLAVTWLPLLLISALEGRAWGAATTVPFLLDVEVNARFLIALPLLLSAELIVHRRMRLVVRQFLDRHLIPESALPRFNAAIASAFRLRNSIVAEVLLLVLVYAVGTLQWWSHYFAVSSASWYGTTASGTLRMSLTGGWYTFVSLPLFQFLLVRWYFRVFVWARFLWRVSRIELSLVPTHPDKVGGLGFLANVAFAFTPLAVAHGVMLAGPIANRIFFAGASLPDFKVEIAVLVALITCVTLAPFLVFAPQLAAAKRAGLREYGTLAERYVREFDVKWLRGGAPDGEPLVGSADIQSLADLANSFDTVKRMQIAPITRDSLLRLAAATLAPVVPLLLTMMSPEELLRKLFNLLF